MWSYYYDKPFINILKIIWKPLKSIYFFQIFFLNIFNSFSHLYQDGTIEAVKLSGKKLKRNSFKVTEHPFRLEEKIKRIEELKKDKKKKEWKIDNKKIKSIRNVFRLEKENEAIKDRMVRDIKVFLVRKRKIIINQ